MLLGSIIIMLGNTLLYLSESILLTYTSMLIFSFGFGLCVTLLYIIIDFCSNKKSMYV